VAGDGRDGLWIGVLGPLEVILDGDRVAIGAGKQRAVLAVLLASAGHVVSTDRLIDDLWGPDGSADRQNALWVHISNLRKALGGDKVLVTRSQGYVLEPAGFTSDVTEFERLVAEGRALAETDPAAATIVLGEALQLWRGRPYEDFTYDSWAEAEISRLTEVRMDAVELRIDCDLRRGLAGELVGELEGLVRQHPLREGLTGSLMLALYRSGRQADALRAGQRLRTRLVDELGIDPSAAIQRLEDRIVSGDPQLDFDGSITGQPGGPLVRGYEIREAIATGPAGTVYRAYQPSVGREVFLKVIPAELADDPDFIRRFEQNAQAIAQIEHPHVVPVYDFWREPGAAYLAMRFLHGGSLADRILRGPLAAGDIARIVDQIGSAVEAVHRTGILVGSLSGENVFFDETGNAFLADLDLAEPVAVGARSVKGDVQALAAVVAQALVGRVGGLPEILVGLAPAMTAALSGPNDDVASFRQGVLAALDAGASSIVIDENPYKGLRSFEAADASDFFGRERFVERLVARLSGRGPGSRFVAVVGPSGSGKSSAVKAGLLPALRGGAAPGSETWYVVKMVPGAHPFDELESALMTVAVDPPPSLLEMLTGERGIARTLRRVLPDDAPLLLVIDQFEELFTLSTAGSAERFLDAVAEVVADDTARVRVVATLRADFYDRPLRHRAMGEMLRLGTEVLTPMSPEELERAITGPAERVGATCEPALVGEMVAAVVEQPSALPLLQFALTEIFDRRDGSILRSSAYRAIGGVSGAVVDRAEAVFSSFDRGEQAAARDVFLRLVTLGEGTGDTRRRALRSELTSITGSGAEAQRVVDVCVRNRLLSLDRDPVTRTPSVEIAHEALLAAWGRLAGWIDEARSDVRARQRLGEAAAEWVSRGGDDGFVLGGGRLGRYEGWLDHPPVALTIDERRFLEASVAVEARRADERAAADRREALLVRRSRTIVGLALLTAVIVALGVFAVVQWNRATVLAVDSSMNEESRRLAALAGNLQGVDVELALMLAVEAVLTTAERGDVLPAALDAVHSALQGARVPYPVEESGVAVRPGIGGVFAMPPSDLIAHAQQHLGERRFTSAECGRFALDPCDGTGRAAPVGLVLSDDSDAYSSSGPTPLAGTTVHIVTPEDGFARLALAANFQRLTEETGIRVEVRGNEDDLSPADIAGHLGDADIVISPQPSLVPELAALGAVEVSRYIDPALFDSIWSPYLRSLVSVGADGTWPDPNGRVYGVWNKLDAKSLLWFRQDVFDAHGWSPPATWNDLRDLTQDILAAGYTPWCVYIGSGDADGWFATDVLESLILKTNGPDVYDDWTTHQIPFDDPIVADATALLVELALTEGHQPSSGVDATRLQFWQGARALVREDPDCLMTPFASFITSFLLPHEFSLVGVSDFPSISPRYDDSLVGGGTFAIARSDRPEVREVMRFMTDPRFGLEGVDSGGIPPSTQFDVSLIQDPRTRTLSSIVHTALRDDLFRFDGSDLMPPEVGLAAFWEGMITLFEQDGRDIEGILGQIEQVWQDLEQP
jgi:DNA-binding SARP family transcriptional activator/ABC-type glycerol-3-phosphate transport system substrate-binding protein